MKVDVALLGELTDPDRAVSVEQDGYDCLWIPETVHDPFPILAVVATNTTRIQLGTSIALAFARNPMSMAMLANDLQLYSGGRFLLGVGSQIKSHITKRFSMPWSAPAERMREYVLAMRAIWHSWDTGAPLRFNGTQYTHTLMTPFFNPGPNPYGNPPIFLAGVGPAMTEVAGEVADGFFVHSFTTERYLREVTLPALAKGRAAAGKVGLEGFDLSVLPFVVTGTTKDEIAAADSAVRAQLAFYGSTLAYRPVLELHGWAAVGEELHALARSGSWTEMGRRITDDILHEFAIVAPPDQVADKIRSRYGEVITRCGFYTPYPMPKGFWQPIARQLQAGTTVTAQSH